MTVPAATALSLLRESRDGEPDAPARIWHDNGRTITALARAAGVKVTYVHVDLATPTTELRTVDGTGNQQEEHTA